VKTLHTVVALVGIGVAGGAAWWYQHKGAGASAAAGVSGSASGPAGGTAPGGPSGPVTVEVGKVEALTLDDDAQGVGSLRSHQGVTLRPEVSGRVSKLGFADGQRVRRGQLLVQLDDTLQQAQLQQAEAQASIARTNLQRNRELVGANFVSQSVLDQSAAALQVAEAQVALARAQLARMRIDAPFDGVAGIRSVNVGDYVKDGADLVNVEDISSVLLDFRLAERYVARIRTGQPVEAQLDAMPGRIFKGQVDAVDSLLDANGRSLLVRARLRNPGGELRSGMFARTRLVFATRANALVVPEEALVPFGGKQYLVKVVDGPKGKQSQRLEARIGMRLPGKVEILEGLAAGDQVVTAGQARLLREPLPLRIVDIHQPQGAASAPSRSASGTAGAKPNVAL
jgi:membrane fusion protein (multidrug efflux system)